MTLRELDAQPDLHAITESRPAEPDGGQPSHVAQFTHAAVTPSARPISSDTRSGSASAGVAPATSADHLTSGDPTQPDRAIVAATPETLLPGHLDGPVPPGTLSHGAVETLPAPDGQAKPSGDHRARGDGRSSHDLQDCAAVAETTDPAIPALTPDVVPQGRGVRQGHRDPQGSAADANSSGPAKTAPTPVRAVQDRGGGQVSHGDHASSAPAIKSRRSKDRPEPIEPVPGEGDGHPPAVANLSRPADHAAFPKAALPDGGDGPSADDAQRISAVATLVDLWRQRVDLRRAEGRLNLQALAVCRRASAGDKEAAQKLWGLIQKGRGPADVSTIVEPYRSAMAVLDGSASGLEKQLAKMVRTLPLWTSWAVNVRGVGELSLAGVIGEASGNPGDYKSVSAIWKRFGLAVIEGGRQRRVANAEDALLHGYAPQRRAFAYVLSTNLMKCQKATDPYRIVYDTRKAYELGRDIPKAHAHNRALRVMVKALFKDLYLADRRGHAPKVESAA